MSYSVSQIANHLGRSGNTVRNRGERFARFLSPGANPEGDAPREYTDDDLLIMQTIEALHRQQLSYDEIEDRLDTGERLEIEGPPPAAQRQKRKAAAQAQEQTALVTESFAEVLRQRDSQLAELTERLIEAEKRATAAETELRILRQQQAQENAQEPESRPWWQFWKG